MFLPSVTTEQGLDVGVFFRGRGCRCGRDHLVALAARERCVGEWYAGFPCGSFPWQWRCNSSQTLRHSLRHAGLLVRRPPRFSYIHFAELEVVFEVVSVPETWATGMAAAVFPLTIKQHFQNPLVAHADHVSSPVQL